MEHVSILLLHEKLALINDYGTDQFLKTKTFCLTSNSKMLFNKTVRL